MKMLSKIAPSPWFDNQNLPRLISLTITCGLFGCSTTVTTSTAPKPADVQQSPPADVASPTTVPAGPSYAAVPASRTHNDVLHTSLEPLTAARAIGDVFSEYGFMAVSSPGFKGLEPTKGDFFTAQTSAATLQNEGLDAVCKWVRPGATDVRFQSDLPTDQHEYLLKAIEKALADAATRPSN